MSLQGVSNRLQSKPQESWPTSLFISLRTLYSLQLFCDKQCILWHTHQSGSRKQIRGLYVKIYDVAYEIVWAAEQVQNEGKIMGKQGTGKNCCPVMEFSPLF